MASSGVLVGLFLLSLLSSAVGAHIKNLPRIIGFLQKDYMDKDHFAVAINIPAEKCSAGVKPDQKFLPDDPTWKVKNTLNSTVRVYRGQRLIGARPKPINATSDYQPEYLLLIRSNPPKNACYDPPLKRLLNRDKHGCVVFYTFNSPCVNNCSTPEGSYNIIPALHLLRKHKGPKVFVFSHVLKHESGSRQGREKPIFHCYRIGAKAYATMSVWDNYDSQVQWEEDIRRINAEVPLYRCNGGKCASCMYDREVDGRCMHNITI